MNRKTYSNMFFAFSAQSISVILSILTSMVLPKFLGVTNYAYWQLFIFYSVYINLLHFGVSDGIYLRIGGESYRNIDKQVIYSQLKLLVFIQIIISAILLTILTAIGLNSDRLFVFYNLFIYMVVYNSVVFFGFVFQAVNETRIHSMAFIIDKITFIIIMVILLFAGVRDYRKFIIGYNISATLALIFISLQGKEILSQKFIGIKKTIQEMMININIGMKLMISAVASNFIVGSTRIVVDKYMGITEFGKLSFSFSIVNFLLAFVRQVSMVLFPALRQFEKKHLTSFFERISLMLDIFLPVILIGYFPINVFFSIWLPAYKDSLYYLRYLLPVVIFDGKAQLLFFTFMKVFREEKKLLYINLACLVCSFLSALFLVNIFHNITYIVFTVMIILAMRSIYMEFYLRKKYFTIDYRILYLVIIVSCFVTSAILFPGVRGMIIYISFYLIYLLVRKKEIKALYMSFKSKKIKN
ncbi:oligosaccharide flippase family protein [Finegoldia magna]|uniref:lipopolysaccharide biosynthesis protein n=1 Tax=Finegoldia magna TaxID=1260 RepID=UPI0028052997|nr:oligosaccharide flippase family protein [Finegoldia magna]MDU1400042.1 oligosaccharide flippase family protein [Finegoldia magna]